MSTDSTWPWPTARYTSVRLTPTNEHEAGVADRQDLVPGFSSEALQQAHILVVGAGGLGGPVAIGLAKKGAGKITIADDDQVELSNLARQEFLPTDLYQFKALALARHAAAQGALGAECVGHAIDFNPKTAPLLGQGVSLAFVGVDNDQTRAVSSQFFRQRGRPAVFAAINEAANYAWAFVQEACGPCLTCVFPAMAAALGEPRPCTPAPATLDVLRTISGLVLYALDSLLMPRRREWNFRSVGLIGDVPDIIDRVRSRPTCAVCALLGNSKDGG